MPFQSANEIANFSRSNRVAWSIALGLHIDDVETEFIFADHAVYAVIARFSYGLSHLRSATAVAHGDEQVDNNLFKLSRRYTKYPIQKIGFHSISKFPMATFYLLFGIRRCLLQLLVVTICFSLFFSCYASLSPFTVRREPLKEFHIDAGGVLAKNF